MICLEKRSICFLFNFLLIFLLSQIRLRLLLFLEAHLFPQNSFCSAIFGLFTLPFGGKNLSGSGFKAGGPNYLLQFMDERVITINTVAIGGNNNK